MSGKRKKYSEEQKSEAVRLAKELGNASEAARDLGIDKSVIYS